MLFPDKIRELRLCKGMLQRHVSAKLDIDNAIYCRIENGKRKAKKEQVIALAEVFCIDSNELIKLWLADRVYDVISEENEANDVLDIVSENMVEYGQNN